MKIPAFNQFNISGLRSAKFTLAENIQSISYPDENHQVIVNLKSGQSWIDLYFTKSSEDSFIDPGCELLSNCIFDLLISAE